MKTRDELLKMASDFIDYANSTNGQEYRMPFINAYANLAKACVMLAKELREGEQTPTYPQMGELITAVHALKFR